MREIILFEIKKIFKSTFFLLIISLFCLLIAGFYIFVYFNTVRAHEEMIRVKKMVDVYEQSIQEFNDEMTSAENQKNSELQEEIDFRVDFRDDLIIEMEAYENKDWNTLLNREIKYNENPKKEHYSSALFPTYFTAVTELEYYKWLRDRNIQPVLQIGIDTWRTVYDIHFSDPVIERDVMERSMKYSSSGIYFTYHVYKLLFGMVGPVLFILLFGDLITKEGLGRNGPIHLLKTQPIRPYHILWSKLLAGIIITVLMILGITLLSILIGTVGDRFGDWDYPVLIYGKDRSFHFIKMGTFLLLSSVMALMVLLFCYTLLFLLSVMTKRTLPAVGLTLAIFFIGTQWSGEPPLSVLAPYIPFHYFSVPEIVTNEFAASIDNFDFSFTTGLAVLGIYSVIFYLLAHAVSTLQKRFG